MEELAGCHTEDEEEDDDAGRLHLDSMAQEVEDAAVDFQGSLVELRERWNCGAMTRWWSPVLSRKTSRGRREEESGGGKERGREGELGHRAAGRLS